MELRSYTLEELEPYLYTLYSKPESLVPVSPLRLQSYLKNPRAKLSDTVLFEMREKGVVVAYRTLLPDCFYDDEDHPHRFAWLSGTWVKPELRRQGISTRLLEMAEEAWEGQLMYTNYAPEAKALFDRTGRFKMLAYREGKRFYLRSALADLLGKRLGNNSLYTTADLLVNGFRKRKLERFRFPMDGECSRTQVDGFVAQLSGLVSKLQKDALFRRDREIFEWALEYPWVSEQACDPVSYHFSYKASRFENIIYQVSHADSGKQGILWLLLHNKVLSVPYLFAGDKHVYSCMSEVVVRTMIEQGCTHMTIRNRALLESLMAYKEIFLSVRNMPQLIFTHQSMIGLIPEKPLIHDGDGDVMFTG